MKLGTDARRAFLLMEMQQRLGRAVVKADYELQGARVQQVLPETHQRNRESESHTLRNIFFDRLGYMTAWKILVRSELLQ